MLDEELTFIKAWGSEPATSANPPTLMSGSASDAKKRTFIFEGLVIWAWDSIILHDLLILDFKTE